MYSFREVPGNEVWCEEVVGLYSNNRYCPSFEVLVEFLLFFFLIRDQCLPPTPLAHAPEDAATIVRQSSALKIQSTADFVTYPVSNRSKGRPEGAHPEAFGRPMGTPVSF